MAEKLTPLTTEMTPGVRRARLRRLDQHADDLVTAEEACEFAAEYLELEGPEKPPMPKGPRGGRRPGDVVGSAIKVARIAVGDEEEELEPDGKDPNAKALGAKGGAARAKSLSAAKRSAIAKKAAAKRWKKK